MDLELTSIAFNHDPEGGSRSSALNIRKNFSTSVALPEYEKRRSSSPQSEPVAYPIRETANVPVFVKATFRRANAGASFTCQIQARGGGVLGRIDPTPIQFQAGKSAVSVNLQLAHRSFEYVGQHEISWSWSARSLDGNSGWVELDSTEHRVYVLLAAPAEPWNASFHSELAPWTDLLDFSCRIARRRRVGGSVTTAMVKAINSNYDLKYDVEEGYQRYFSEKFYLTRWIERVLRRKRSDDTYPLTWCSKLEYWNDWIVNCRDVAGAVTLMTTILGVPVEYVHQTPFGYLRIVEPIGRGPCNNPFYGCDGDPIVPEGADRHPFSYHDFAVFDGKTYDACLRAHLPWWHKVLLGLLEYVSALLFRVRLGWIQERAEGWLVGLNQYRYQSVVIGSPPSGEVGKLPGKPEEGSIRFA